jgi:hypothetical protein
MSTVFTNISYADSVLRDDYARFVVVHGRPRPLPVSPARQRAQAAWVRQRVREDHDLDVRDFPAYQVIPSTRGIAHGQTNVYLGGP